MYFILSIKYENYRPDSFLCVLRSDSKCRDIESLWVTIFYYVYDSCLSVGVSIMYWFVDSIMSCSSSNYLFFLCCRLFCFSLKLHREIRFERTSYKKNTGQDQILLLVILRVILVCKFAPSRSSHNHSTYQCFWEQDTRHLELWTQGKLWGDQVTLERSVYDVSTEMTVETYFCPTNFF